MDLEKTEARNNYAGEDQQQFNHLRRRDLLRRLPGRGNSVWVSEDYHCMRIRSADTCFLSRRLTTDNFYAKLPE